MTVLRDQLLAGRAIALGGVSDHLHQRLESLGAQIEALPAADELPADEERVGEWARSRAPLQALVYDSSGAFASGGEAALQSALERAWCVVREVATGALIPSEGPGQVLLIGPVPDAGALSGAARAALENLARTLSVEWARYQVTAVMIAPGTGTTEEELAELVCFLVSEAGGYFSGCRIDLGAVGE
jgi:NAD(P)-dependent dehydrogenase (short-subunit alcohol dehydrogenase family)